MVAGGSCLPARPRQMSRAHPPRYGTLGMADRVKAVARYGTRALGRRATEPSIGRGACVATALPPGGGATSSPTEPASVVALAVEGLHGGRAGAGPLRHGPAGRAPGGDAVGVRAPGPADRRAMPTDRRVGLRGLGPALGVVLPRLAAAPRRHVDQGEGPGDPLVAPAP